jgi:hypothetical protein
MPFCCLDNDPDGTNESCGFGVVNYENGRKMIYILYRTSTIILRLFMALHGCMAGARPSRHSTDANPNRAEAGFSYPHKEGMRHPQRCTIRSYRPFVRQDRSMYRRRGRIHRYVSTITITNADCERIHHVGESWTGPYLYLDSLERSRPRCFLVPIAQWERPEYMGECG